MQRRREFSRRRRRYVFLCWLPYSSSSPRIPSSLPPSRLSDFLAHLLLPPRLLTSHSQRSLQSTVNTLRATCSAFESENLSLSETLSSHQRSSKHSITSLSNDVHLLKSRLEASEQETRGYKDKAEEWGLEVKSLRAKVGELVEELEKVRRDEGEEKVGRVLREELHREFSSLPSN